MSGGPFQGLSDDEIEFIARFRARVERRGCMFAEHGRGPLGGLELWIVGADGRRHRTVVDVVGPGYARVCRGSLALSAGAVRLEIEIADEAVRAAAMSAGGTDE